MRHGRSDQRSAHLDSWNRDLDLQPDMPVPQQYQLHTMDEKAMRSAAARIAQSLDEYDASAYFQIVRAIRILGLARVEAFVIEAHRVQVDGGLPTADGRRPRTPGGVLFRLMRTGLPRPQRWYVFPDLGRRQRGSVQLPTTDISHLTGEVHKVNITIAGRPQRIIPRQGHVLVTLIDANLPNLPKGLPKMPKLATLYCLYISTKQWAAVAEALRDPDDMLMVEGVAALDQQQEGIAVYVRKTTTRKLRQQLNATRKARQTL